MLYVTCPKKACVTGPTNAAIAAHLLDLVAPLVGMVYGPNYAAFPFAPLDGPDLVMLNSLDAPLVSPDQICVHNGSITWS